MKLLVPFIVFLFSTSVVSAQVTDDQIQSTEIPAIEVEKEVGTNKSDDLNIIEKEETPLALPVRKYTDSFNLTERKSKGFNMIHDNDLINPGVIFEEKWAKKKIVEAQTEFQGDQFLGRFDVKAVFVNVIYRDHEYPDGDRIRVYLNDDIIRSNVLLTNGYNGFKLNLIKGINKLDFEALNQGESGPNTAEFQVYDDNENLVSANRWNLSTGSRATIIIVKE